MAYADYDFYTNKYYGDAIPEEAFEKFAQRASDRIDLLTYDRLIDGLPQNERAQTRIKQAVCSVAEALYWIDQIQKSSRESIGTITREDGTVVSKAVSSVSSGSESISYATGGAGQSDAYSLAAANKTAENALLYGMALEYLSNVTTDEGVNLLYSGMGR